MKIIFSRYKNIMHKLEGSLLPCTSTKAWFRRSEKISYAELFSLFNTASRTLELYHAQLMSQTNKKRSKCEICFATCKPGRTFVKQRKELLHYHFSHFCLCPKFNLTSLPSVPRPDYSVFGEAMSHLKSTGLLGSD